MAENSGGVWKIMENCGGKQRDVWKTAENCGGKLRDVRKTTEIYGGKQRGIWKTAEMCGDVQKIAETCGFFCRKHGRLLSAGKKPVGQWGLEGVS